MGASFEVDRFGMEWHGMGEEMARGSIHSYHRWDGSEWKSSHRGTGFGGSQIKRDAIRQEDSQGPRMRKAGNDSNRHINQLKPQL